MVSRRHLRLGCSAVMRETGNAVTGWFKRAVSFDAALAAVVVAVVALMIIPLPTPLLDVLLACNLALSVSILLVVLYVPGGLHIASFPSLLLITTLLRIGLDVAATRLILLRGNAGEVIRSFGRFVVGNNYVVGAVVFLVISIVQYLVIAKGSERVAEVGARFTLDALPGKQLGIDAELRSGAIDVEQARHKRQQLSRESQFYGAMDGAMKFVKGDVIASIVIAGVNIVGGLAIGVGQRDLSFADALHRYGLLTIGNGLVTQVPALILATAAGILVTRVASEGSEQSLGAELGAQLLGEPRALLVASVFILGLGLVPGLPWLPFSVIGIALFFASRVRARHLAIRSLQRARTEPVVHPVAAADALRFVPIVIPWSLVLGNPAHSVGRLPKNSPALGNAGGKGQPPLQETLRAATDRLREQIFIELGVPLPECDLQIDDAQATGQLQLRLHEVDCQQVALPEPATDTQVSRIVLEQLTPVLRRHAAEFLGMAETQMLLNALETVAPQTVRQVVPKVVSLATLTEILRRLVEEGISVRDLSSILQALTLASSSERDPLALAEFVRAGLRRSTTHQLTAGETRLGVILLDPSVEEVVRAGITHSTTGAFLALAPSATADIVSAVARAVAEAAKQHSKTPVLLAAPDTRRFIRRLLEAKLPDLRVISPAELLPEIALETWSVASVTDL